MNRRRFLSVSALWTAAAAVHAIPGSARAVPRPPGANYDVIVIGSGLGGLAFAGYVAKHGFKVLVLEQHDIPGGYATTFGRGRFTFDVSLHQIALNKTTWQTLEDLGVGAKLKFVRPPHLFRLVSKGLDINCPAGQPQAFQDILIRRYPGDEKGVKGFMEEMLGLNEEVEKFFGEGKLNLARKIVFPLRFPRMWGARNKSLADYLYRYVSHPELRAVLSVFCEYYGLPPSKLSAFYYMNATGAFFKHGGSYPFGGSQAISNALVRVIEDRGGEVRLSTKVDRVLVSDGKVSGIRVSDGKVEKVPAVAANCSAVTLFGKMIERQHIPGEYLDKIQRLRPSISSFVVWLGLNKDITDKIRDSHIFLCSETDAEKAFQFGLEGEADRANLSVCIYSNIYKDYSPPGTTALSITLISGYDSWKPFEQDYWAGRKAQYRQKKQEIAEKLIRRVESDLVPGLSGMIEVREVATPLTNARFTLNTQGAIYGFEQSIDNSFMNRISNRTPIKGLYLAGAWGEPGGGYAGVLISGKRTFGMLMEEWGSD